jgi:hypothetical protein
MTVLIRMLTLIAACTVLATSACAQSAKAVRGASPYAAIDNESAPKLIVDPPLPDQLAMGIIQIQYRAENVHRCSERVHSPYLPASGICT